MSRELTLHVDQGWQHRTPLDSVLALTHLWVAPDPEFLDALEALQEQHGRTSGHALTLFTDEGIGHDADDAYGRPLYWLEAQDFVALADPQWEPWNQAVLAFLGACEPKTRVYLYWS